MIGEFTIHAYISSVYRIESKVEAVGIPIKKAAVIAGYHSPS